MSGLPAGLKPDGWGGWETTSRRRRPGSQKMATAAESAGHVTTYRFCRERTGEWQPGPICRVCEPKP